MKVLVCLKQILDPEIPPRDFKIDAARLEADQGSANLVTNIFCENALETALLLRDAHGGDITALTFGPDQAEDVLRKALAVRVAKEAPTLKGFPRRPLCLGPESANSIHTLSMHMSYETISYDVDEQVATITLNRPDRMNAITKQLEDELLDAMQTAEASDDVRVIILTGAGRGFCAGADLSNLGAATETDWQSVDESELRQQLMPIRPRDDARGDFQMTYSYFPAITKPIIGAINGAAVGLGFVMPLYCDIRIASDQARFGTAFAQRGLIAEYGVSWMLPRLVGLSNALDLLYSARMIDAQEALRMGLVSRIVPHDQLLAEVRRYATLLATTVSPRSLRIIKKQIYDALFSDLAEATDIAYDETILSLQCEDFKEGVAHFVEQRTPRFTGK